MNYEPRAIPPVVREARGICSTRRSAMIHAPPARQDLMRNESSADLERFIHMLRKSSQNMDYPISWLPRRDENELRATCQRAPRTMRTNSTLRCVRSGNAVVGQLNGTYTTNDDSFATSRGFRYRAGDKPVSPASRRSRTSAHSEPRSSMRLSILVSRGNDNSLTLLLL